MPEADSFGNVTDDDELREAWFDAMEAYASNPTSSESRLAEAVTRAEFALRGIEPPWPFVSCVLAEVRAKVAKLFESLPPGKLRKIDERLTADLVGYLHRRDRPQN
jgi:hypothetical protein